MSRVVRVLCILVMLALAFPAAAVTAAPQAQAATPPNLPPNCKTLVQPDKETYLICMPSTPPTGLVVFAHGYVFDNPTDPTPILPYDQLMTPDQQMFIPQMITSLGYAFAMTSYSKNGLAVQEGVNDTLNLISFMQSIPEVKGKKVYLVGASEGGLVTTLLVENDPSVISGGLAVCGPLGDFRKQINYWGDFRAVFDYLTLNPATGKSLLPADAVNVPLPVMADWAKGLSASTYQQAVVAWLTQNPTQAARLFLNTKAPIVPTDPNTAGQTTLGILSYNILATNEARLELSKGLAMPVVVQPYDNTNTLYPDPAIMMKITRYKAVPSSATIDAVLKPYQTSGVLTKPLVTMHTLLDPIVPAWHQLLYNQKVAASGSTAKYNGIVIPAYGHCNFTASQLLFGFGLMIYKANRQPVTLQQARNILPNEAEYAAFIQLNRENVNITDFRVFAPLTTGH